MLAGADEEMNVAMSRVVPVLVLIAAGGARLVRAEAQPLPLTDGGWELKGPSVKLERYDGRDVLSVENGFAYRRDVRLQDGSVDFDVQLTRRRSFVYLMVRMADDREYEDFYLRPHKSVAARRDPVRAGLPGRERVAALPRPGRHGTRDVRARRLDARAAGAAG